MPTLDLSDAQALSVASLEALEVRVADETVWAKALTEYPAEVVWTDAIPDAEISRWSVLSGQALATASTQTHTSPRALYVAGSVGGVYGTTVSGLVVGREYTFSAWFRGNGGTGLYAVGVSGIGAGVPTGAPATTYVERTYTFVATATSHVLEAHVAGTPTRFDDFTLTRAAYVA